MQFIEESRGKAPHQFVWALALLASTIALVQFFNNAALPTATLQLFQPGRFVVDNLFAPLTIAGVSALIVWHNLTAHSILKRRYAFLAGLIIACVVFAWELVLNQSVGVLESMLGRTSSSIFKALSLCTVTIPPVAWMLWLGLSAEASASDQDSSPGTLPLGIKPHVLVLCGVAALLGFFASVSLATTLIWSHQKRQIDGYTDLINLSGRQRMLTQQIGRYAALAERHGGHYPQKLQEAKSLMIAEAGRINERISELSRIGSFTKDRDSRLISRMMEQRDALWREADAFLANAAQRAHHSSAGIQIASDALAEMLERVVAALGKRANERVLETTEKVTRFGSLLIFIVITGTLSIVLPIAWVVRHQHRRLDRHARMLQEARADTQKTLNRLSAYQAALSKKAIISITDRRGRIEEVNDLFCEISQYSREELVGRDHNIINSGYHPPEFFAGMWRTIRRGELWTADVCNRTKDGSLYWVDTTVVPIFDKSGQISQFLSIRYDITARKHEREALKESEAHLNRAQAVAKVGSWSTDLVTNELRWSSETYRIFGIPPGTPLTYELFLSCVHPDDRAAVDASWRAALGGQPYSIEHRIVVDGVVKYVHERADFEFDRAGRALRAVGTVQDITERKSTEAKLMWQAQYDILTELPNRRLFQDRLENALASRRRDGNSGAVLMIDLDHFKDVNDRLGHKAGDDVLVATAKRLRSCINSCDTIARFGGDEFLVLLETVDGPRAAENVAKKILDALALPFETEQRELRLGCSIGVCIFPTDGETVDEILIFADAAMYAAKHAGRRTVCFYTESINQQLQERISVAEELHAALAENQLSLVFQPIVDLCTNEVRKCEALVRWRHPAKGLLSPGQFLPVAEAYGLMPEIENWVIEEVVKQHDRWRRAGLDLEISLNISADYLGSESNVTELKTLLGDGPDGARRLILEITETHLMHDEGAQFDRLARLIEAGAVIAIDDFGTGYSSLSYLTRIPAKYLKIDRSFITSMHSALQRRLVRSVIGIAHDVGMKVVAEGVETNEQLQALLDYGCDYAQGYLFAGPLSEQEFRQYISSFPEASVLRETAHRRTVSPGR